MSRFPLEAYFLFLEIGDDICSLCQLILEIFNRRFVVFQFIRLLRAGVDSFHAPFMNDDLCRFLYAFVVFCQLY